KIVWDDSSSAYGCGAIARGASGGETPGRQFAGGHRSRVPPVPIPNTEVKPATADGTMWETAWESRSLPALIPKPAVNYHSGLFCVWAPDGPCSFPHGPSAATPPTRAARGER